jgi:cation-transporting ATPase 13A3/4/5
MIVLVSCGGVIQLWSKFNGKLNETFLIKKCLELISTAIPPELPAALIIGLSLAMSRLKSKNIFCPDPYSIL